jgi:hypothetical protein
VGYKTWMKVAPDGTIESVVWQHDRHPAPTEHPVPCVDKEHEHELRKNAGLYRYCDGGRVRHRTAVHWIVNGRGSAAVGENIRLHLAGLPEGYREPVRVLVGDLEVDLAHPYILDLGWENPARVGIRLAHDPKMVQTAHMNVQFLERRQK